MTPSREQVEISDLPDLVSGLVPRRRSIPSRAQHLGSQVRGSSSLVVLGRPQDGVVQVADVFQRGDVRPTAGSPVRPRPSKNERWTAPTDARTGLRAGPTPAENPPGAKRN